MRDGSITVNSRGVQVPRDLSRDVVKDEIFLHHYSTRSAEEFAAKVQRGGGIHKTGRYNPSHLAFVDSRCTLTCLDALRYVPQANST